MIQYKNNKTGNIYKIVSQDVGNITPDEIHTKKLTPMILFEDIRGNLFIKEVPEFLENFSLVELNERELISCVRDFLKKGQMLQAVKFIKDQTGKGLKESKEFVDDVRFGVKV